MSGGTHAEEESAPHRFPYVFSVVRVALMGAGEKRKPRPRARNGGGSRPRPPGSPRARPRRGCCRCSWRICCATRSAALECSGSCVSPCTRRICASGCVAFQRVMAKRPHLTIWAPSAATGPVIGAAKPMVWAVPHVIRAASADAASEGAAAGRRGRGSEYHYEREKCEQQASESRICPRPVSPHLHPFLLLWLPSF